MGKIDLEITGIVLAGGQSRRMGFNKAEAFIDGESLLNRMIKKMEETTNKILISSGTTKYTNINYTQIADEYPNCGPIGGIYSALKASISCLNLIVSCDIPLISTSLLRYLISEAQLSEALITIPVDHVGQYQILSAVYNKKIIPILENQIKNGQFKLKNLLSLAPIKYIYISQDHPQFNEYNFININTLDILKQTQYLWETRFK